MEFEVGAILTGKVTAIAKFGAFVSFNSGKSGLVHISEIANTYVNNISDFLKEGQEVNVKVISIDDAGRINLSIKQALPQQQPQQRRPQKNDRPAQSGQRNSSNQRSSSNANAPKEQRENAISDAARAYTPEKSNDASFEDKLKRFMQDSDNKISGLYADHKVSRRRQR